ncbi:MAG: hypothetical protein CL607_10360 [Anaerolineaceae bacterium]|nr:hypothetical protein [Anaerolineaceae bacterium]
MKIKVEQLILDGVVALSHHGYYDPEVAAQRYHDIFFGSEMTLPRVIVCDATHVMYKRPRKANQNGNLPNSEETRLYGSSRPDLPMIASIVGDDDVERLVCITGKNDDVAQRLEERYRKLGLLHKVNIVDTTSEAVSIIESLVEAEPSAS